MRRQLVGRDEPDYLHVDRLPTGMVNRSECQAKLFGVRERHAAGSVGLEVAKSTRAGNMNVRVLCAAADGQGRARLLG